MFKKTEKVPAWVSVIFVTFINLIRFGPHFVVQVPSMLLFFEFDNNHVSTFPF